ncbi:HPF/RaiA family ribosome-associated protein [Mycobacterium sp. PSTR-4-N]|uniref:ribosome hibernation promotion factor n=1 Tax=Mycobacterium sp. PSTR-4-N TaxID=2917745 RepID=UPI001F14FC6E|nr:HPF/RaiA family ribosome-associated protein [Mycobacterium sp. PSTR-4-N]MCG7592611.1 HPF/RaiA family ribosome-associated protein [Mycobacterium sp. PSTR-4-N]
MSQKVTTSPTIDVDVTVRGDLPGAADYARTKIGELGRVSHRRVLSARVRLSRHHDPAVDAPVVAQANLIVGGRLVRAQVHAVTAREAVDLLQAKLRRQLEHFALRRGDRRAGVPAWRREQRAVQPPPDATPAVGRVRISRRKTYAMTPCTVDDAIDEMELLDYRFHLFTEIGSGTVGLLYRTDDGRHRLALVSPSVRDQLAPFEEPVTVSPHPLSCLREQDARERLSLLGLPFLFYIDAEAGRACVLYRRYDGQYGLITPAVQPIPQVSPQVPPL